jgi:hypothetical protein
LKGFGPADQNRWDRFRQARGLAISGQLTRSAARKGARISADVLALLAPVENDLASQRLIHEVAATPRGPMDLGSTFREVHRMLARTSVWDMRVTA